MGNIGKAVAKRAKGFTQRRRPLTCVNPHIY